MQSVQNFLTACGTILAYCSDSPVSKITHAGRTVSLRQHMAVFYPGQGTLLSKIKKVRCQGGIFRSILSKFYHSLFRGVPIKSAIDPGHSPSGLGTVAISHKNSHHGLPVLWQKHHTAPPCTVPSAAHRLQSGWGSFLYRTRHFFSNKKRCRRRRAFCGMLMLYITRRSASAASPDRCSWADGDWCRW